MKRFVTGIAAGAVAALLLMSQIGTSAVAEHQPANKAVASGNKVQVFAPGESIELMRATLKTSNPTDLLLEVNLECTILTALTTGGENSALSQASGDIRVWLEFGNGDDVIIVPINDVSAKASEDRVGGDDSDKVTFCNRTYQREVTDTENDDDGTDTIDDYIETKSAHSFSWVLLNAGSGVHDVVVRADLTTATIGDATATAMVGNRTLIVEPTKMANDAAV